jgi:hypothetical protein
VVNILDTFYSLYGFGKVGYIPKNNHWRDQVQVISSKSCRAEKIVLKAGENIKGNLDWVPRISSRGLMLLTLI